jgi:hypothetical protein
VKFIDFEKKEWQEFVKKNLNYILCIYFEFHLKINVLTSKKYFQNSHPFKQHVEQNIVNIEHQSIPIDTQLHLIHDKTIF